MRVSMSSRKPHPTIQLVLHGRECEIDRDIAPLIEWLNRQPGVRTLYCCQGEDDPVERWAPYVLFTVERQEQLEPVLRLLQHRRPGTEDYDMLGQCQLSYYARERLIRYRVEWASTLWLQLTIRKLLGGRIGPAIRQELQRIRDLEI